MQKIQPNQKKEDRLKILAVSSNIKSSISEIRVKTPLTEVRKIDNIHIRFRSSHEVDGSDILWSDVFLLQRDANPEFIKWITFAKNLDKFFIFEIDDLLTAMPDFLSHHQKIINNRQAIQYALGNADIISTSTKRLAEALRKSSHKNIHITQNYATPTTHPSATIQHIQ
jgi:hypothetical protein